MSAPASAQITDTFVQFEARCLTRVVTLRETDVSRPSLTAIETNWES